MLGGLPGPAMKVATRILLFLAAFSASCGGPPDSTSGALDGSVDSTSARESGVADATTTSDQTPGVDAAVDSTGDTSLKAGGDGPEAEAGGDAPADAPDASFSDDADASKEADARGDARALDAKADGPSCSLFQDAGVYGGGAFYWGLAAADVDGDGRLDLVAADHNGAGAVNVLLGNGDGTFQSLVSYPAGTASSVASADFNGDRHADLVVTNSEIGILLGTGDGSFPGIVQLDAGGFGPAQVVTGDLNRDGFEDLAVANYNHKGTVTVILGAGDGGFLPQVSYPTRGRAPNAIVGVDLNNDGRLDLAVANLESSSVSVLVGHGDGTFRRAVNYTVGSYPQSIASGDLNGDGAVDLIVVATGGIGVLFGNGDGTFQTTVTRPILSGLHVATADWDGDGILDLALAGANPADVVWILLGNGNGTFRKALRFGIGGANEYVTWLIAADVNGDGLMDIAAVDGISVNVLLNTGCKP